MEVKMVKTSSIIFMAISFVLGVIFPIVSAFVFHKKLRFVWKSVLIGALIYFFLSLLIGEFAFYWYLPKNAWYVELYRKYHFLPLFLLALSSGIFEEIGRYVAFKFFLKDHLTWENGIGYGIGHGGLESVNKGISVPLRDLIFAIVLSANRTMPGLTSSMINKLIETPPYVFLIAGIGIVIAFIGQIALSLIVLYAVKNRKISFLFLAILLHIISDSITSTGIALLSMKKSWSIVLAFCWLAIWIALVVWIFKSKKYLESNSNPNESTIESIE